MFILTTRRDVHWTRDEITRCRHLQFAGRGDQIVQLMGS